MIEIKIFQLHLHVTASFQCPHKKADSSHEIIRNDATCNKLPKYFPFPLENNHKNYVNDKKSFRFTRRSFNFPPFHFLFVFENVLSQFYGDVKISCFATVLITARPRIFMVPLFSGIRVAKCANKSPYRNVRIFPILALIRTSPQSPNASKFKSNSLKNLLDIGARV